MLHCAMCSVTHPGSEVLAVTRLPAARHSAARECSPGNCSSLRLRFTHGRIRFSVLTVRPAWTTEMLQQLRETCESPSCTESEEVGVSDKGGWRT